MTQPQPKSGPFAEIVEISVILSRPAGGPPNPYLDDVIELFGEPPVDHPKQWNKYFEAKWRWREVAKWTHHPASDPRDACLAQYGFAIPNELALAALAQRSPILEVGAGSGYWAWCLRERGVDVLACDTRDDWPCNEREPWTEVMLADGRVMAREHPDRTLLLCWPSMERWAAEILQAYRGQRVVYIGEGEGGCTGDRAFHRLLSWRWRCVEAIEIPVWLGLHDHMYCYERKTAEPSSPSLT